MKKRLTAERRNEIAQLLLRNGNMKAGDLARKFDVSTETIRKDLMLTGQYSSFLKRESSFWMQEALLMPLRSF